MNFLALSFSILLLLAYSGTSLSDTSEQSTTTELKAVNEDISQLKNQLQKLNKERSSTEKQLLRTEQEISALQKDMAAIEKQIKDGLQSIKKLKSQQGQLTAKKDREKQRIAKSLRSIYMTSGDDRFKLLLNQEDPEEISRQLVYLEYLQEAQLKAIKHFETIIAELEKNKHEQNTINQDLLTKKERLQQKNQALVKQNAQRQELVAQLSAQHLKGGKQLDNLEKQRTELETVLANLKSRNINNNAPFSKMKGKLLWPVKGKILSGYNQRRTDTQMRWQGILIAAPKGQQAKAVYDGRVIFADWLRGYGLLIIIDHGKDYLTLYAHNQSLLRKEGDVVLAGEPLALTGQTGGQSVPALYFEVRLKGKQQNPMLWLSR